VPAWLTRLLDAVNLDGLLEERVVATLGTLVVLWLARWIVLTFVQPRLSRPRTRYVWRKTATYLAIGLSVLLVGRIWFSGFSDVATFLGLLSAGVAVALRDWIANFFGWVYLITWRPFSVGDRIEIGEVAGDVIDIGLFATSLLEIGNWVQADQSTGRVVQVPNGKVMVEPVANYTAGLHYVWHELPVMVTFESDWKAAKAILLELATEASKETVAEAERDLRETSKKWLITYRTLTPIVYTRVADSGVVLTIRYLTPPRRRRGTEEALWEAILEAFGARDDLDFAYPTRRLYDHALEGPGGPDGVRSRRSPDRA
jgi:small-conductance mechanosensitive channel